MTVNVAGWLAAFGIGALVGALYFTLLWRAVRALTRASWSPPFRMFAFYLHVLGRVALVFAGLMLAVILEAPADEIIAAVAGFVAARFAVTSLINRRGGEGA